MEKQTEEKVRELISNYAIEFAEWCSGAGYIFMPNFQRWEDKDGYVYTSDELLRRFNKNEK